MGYPFKAWFGRAVAAGMVLGACLLLSGCDTLLGLLTPHEVEREIRSNHEDPGRMTEKIDLERSLETSRDVDRQNEKDDAARIRQFNERFEKQLRNQEDVKP
jgi:hypothetical protein